MDPLPNAPFTRRDFAAHQLTEARVRRLVVEGQLRRPFAGVYCPTDLPDSVDVRARCAALVVPEHSAVCDLAAAYLWGIDLYAPGERYAVPRVDLVALRGNARLRRAGLRGGERDLRPDELTEIAGVRLTVPVRTALDVACLRGRSRAMTALDAFMRAHSLTLNDYRRGLSRFAGRRGVTQARELVELATPKSESPAESWTRLAIIDGGLPVPKPQHSVTIGGVEIFRLDLAYPQWRVAVEYDGEEFHGPERQAHDQARREWLRSHGWYVIVIGKEDLSGAALEAWLGELRRVIADRAEHGKRRYARGERLGRR